MPSILERVLRTGDKKTLKRLRNYADAINILEEDFKALSDAELRGETDTLKQRTGRFPKPLHSFRETCFS